MLKYFLDILDDTGTFVAFAKSVFIIKNKNYIFYRKKNTDSFANILLSHPKSIKSTHPTNSFVAIDQNGKFIFSGHEDRG
jgi:aminoglycoside N3'-acetyltransferase